MGFRKIDEGINLNIINTQKFKTICIAVLIRNKLSRKYASFNSLISNILLNGCEKYKTIREINLKIEEMNGSSIHSDIIKKGENQIIEILFEFPQNFKDIDEIIDFLSNIILRPLKNGDSFNENTFKKARALTIEKIKSNENNKQELAKDRCIEHMFKGEDFGVNCDGYLEDFEENYINEENLFLYYKNILKESEIDFVCIGNIDEDILYNSIKKHFVIENRNFKKIEIKFIEKDNSKINYIQEQSSVIQGKLCMGFRSNIKPYSNEFLPLILGNEILGGGASSKLFNNIREKESLCYYINSFIFIFKGVMFVQAGIDFDCYEKIISYIEKEVENIKNGQFSKEDIEMAKLSLEKKYLSIMDYNTATMDYYYTNFLVDTNMDIEKTISNIKNIDKIQIENSFKKLYLDTVYFMKGE